MPLQPNVLVEWAKNNIGENLSQSSRGCQLPLEQQRLSLESQKFLLKHAENAARSSSKRLIKNYTPFKNKQVF